MYDLFLSEAALERRRKRLPRRLKPLITNVSYVQAAYQPLGSYGKAIAVLQGQKGPLSYRDWRVSLIASDVSIGYFEIWQYSRAVGSSVCFLLQKAYLHVYLPRPSGIDQVLLFLHCDPQEPKESLHYRYKIAPHLHFEIAPRPWNDAHVPLCDGRQDEVLQSLEDLDEAIARAIDFIAEEFLPLLKTSD